ncbi:outer membrane protein [Pseudooceanicola sp. C21-150M6]|uniref:outer membrane protein n=1 Tax=Pseudooceanicola sp. C21-150M6 TaxID=3434355 RepID=UPI003D7F84C6
MNRTKIAILGSAVFVTMGGAAVAGSPTPAPADPVIVEPVVPVMQTGDWTGGYFGGSLGYADIDGGGASGDGVIGGLQLGYDYDFGSFVAGAELEALGSDVDLGGVSLDNMYRLKARMGYDAGPALIYATGGYANADSSIGNDDGWVAGVGAEYMMTDKVSVGGEYLYHEFNDFNGSGTDVTGNTFAARVNYRF